MKVNVFPSIHLGDGPVDTVMSDYQLIHYSNSRLVEIESRRKRRRYLKNLEKFTYNEFSKELKKLSRSQGRILVRLLNRQTGLTAHTIVSEYRNSIRAFIYQTAASLFKISL